MADNSSLDGGGSALEGPVNINSILDLVLPCLPVNKDLLTYRLVCPKWNEKVIAKCNSTGSFSVNVLGSSQLSMEVFVGLTPSFRPKIFRFTQIDLEGRLLISPRIFQNFSRNHCPFLETLILVNCDLPAMRFIEMMAFCCRIRRLQIGICPQIFKPDLGIFHVAFCFIHVQRNMAGLAHLQLKEQRLFNEDLLGIAKSCNSLKFLHIHILEGYLPCAAIFTILKNNAGTLQTLHLIGNLFKNFNMDDGFDLLDALDKLPDMKELETLKLKSGNYKSEDHATFLHRFFNKCPNLKKLCLFDANIPGLNSFKKFESGLLELDLRNCYFDWEKSECEFLKLNTLKIYHRRAYDCKSEEDTLATSCQVLLDSLKISLVTLELRSIICAPFCLSFITPGNYPALTDLMLLSLSDITVHDLRNLLLRFPYLENLSINDCSGIDDSCLSDLNNAGVFDKLQCLIFLNLANSDVGELSALYYFSNMKSLKYLDLSSTMLTLEGLFGLLAQMPSLDTVSFNNTPCESEMDPDCISRLLDMHPHVTLNYFSELF